MLHINDYECGYDDMMGFGSDDRQQGQMAPMTGMGCPPMAACPTPPVVEAPRERVVNRCIVHQVPHVCPINTRVINHHVCRHTYCPAYTSCEQNVVSHVHEGCCGMFQ
jgi:hypothetical protein